MGQATRPELGGGLTGRINANVSVFANVDYEFAVGARRARNEAAFEARLAHDTRGELRSRTPFSARDLCQGKRSRQTASRRFDSFPKPFGMAAICALPSSTASSSHAGSSPSGYRRALGQGPRRGGQALS